MAAGKKKVAAKPTRASANESKWKKGLAKSEAGGKGQDPLFPEEGTYQCTFLGLIAPEPVPGKDEWVNARFQIESGPAGEGEEVTQLHCMSNKSLAASFPRLKSLCMAITGCPTQEQFDEWDPNGDFFDALLGFDNEYASLVDDYVGQAKVQVRVVSGGEARDGDWYRNASYSIAAE